MKRILFLALLLISLTIFGADKKGKPLFNGKDLKGWVIHGTEKWYVEDGLLVCESGPDKGYGYLSTEKNYDNFELTVEFLQEANGNSGIFSGLLLKVQKSRAGRLKLPHLTMIRAEFMNPMEGDGWYRFPMKKKTS